MFRGKKRGYTSYKDKSTFKKVIGPIFKFLLILFISLQFVQVFIIQSVSIASSSMEPQYHKGDRVFVLPFMYGPKLPFADARVAGIKHPERGDLVFIKNPEKKETFFLTNLFDPVVRFFTFNQVSLKKSFQANWQKEEYIKRVIGLPGDTVRMEDFIIYIKPKGYDQFIIESALITTEYELAIDGISEFWKKEYPFSGSMKEMELGENEYFVAGDNRMNSADSRIWGTVPFSSFEGAVIFRYWEGVE